MKLRRSVAARSVLSVVLAYGLVTQALPDSANARVTTVEPNTFGSVNKAAILPLAVTGELSEADRQKLTDELVSGLQRGAFSIASPSDVLASVPEAAGCEKPRCFRDIATRTASTHVVRALVTVRDRDYAVKVSLVDGRTGEELATGQDSCEICGVVDAGNMVATAAATLRTKLDALAKGPSTLVLTSDPRGAVVTIDGQIVGTTPLERPVAPGKHIVRVSRDGYIAIEREVTFVEGMRETLEFALEKVPSRLPGRGWGWASMFVGLATTGGGLAMTVMHDRPFQPDCNGTNIDDSGECRWLWNTKWYGAAMLVAGVALTTLGIAILVEKPSQRKQTSKRDRKRRARANVGVGPASVMVSGRF